MLSVVGVRARLRFLVRMAARLGRSLNLTLRAHRSRLGHDLLGKTGDGASHWIHHWINLVRPNQAGHLLSTKKETKTETNLMTVVTLNQILRDNFSTFLQRPQLSGDLAQSADDFLIPP